MKRIAFSTLFVAIFGYALPSIAQTTVYDGFNYAPVGSALTGQSGGGERGLSGTWGEIGSSDYTIGAGSLSSPYLLLPASGNMVTTGASSSDQRATRSLAVPLGTPGTTEYFSFLLQPTGTIGQGKDDGYFGLDLDGTVNKVFIGKPGPHAANPDLYDIEVAGGTNQVPSGIAAVSGQTVFMVLRADFTSGNDTFSLYIDPGSTEPAAADAVNSEINVGMINGIEIAGSGAFNFDELRIGATYASVVPEPSSLAIVSVCLCAGAACLVIGKKRATVCAID